MTGTDPSANRGAKVNHGGSPTPVREFLSGLCGAGAVAVTDKAAENLGRPWAKNLCQHASELLGPLQLAAPCGVRRWRSYGRGASERAA